MNNTNGRKEAKPYGLKEAMSKKRIKEIKFWWPKDWYKTNVSYFRWDTKVLAESYWGKGNVVQMVLKESEKK